MDFKKLIGLVLGKDDGKGNAITKISEAMRFIDKYKDTFTAIVAVIGPLIAMFKGGQKHFEDGQPPVAPPKPPVIPPPAPLPTPTTDYQVARIVGKITAIEEDRHGGSGGEIATLARFKECCVDGGTDAVRVGERIHTDFTAFNAAGQEIPREVVQKMKKANGAPAFDPRWTVDGKMNWNSTDEPDRLELQSYDDHDNGLTPTYLHNIGQPGRKKFEVWQTLAAEDNGGKAVEGEKATNVAGGTGTYLD